MKLYLFFILGSAAAIFCANAIAAAVLGTGQIWLILLIVVLNVVILVAIDAIFAYIIHRLLPRRWFNANYKFFRVRKGERAFYDALRIVKWKDKIPESGGKLAGFDKKKIADTKSAYLFEFLTETCLAEVIHYAMLLTSVINLFLYPFAFILTITLPCSIVNLLCQIPPILIQRYNRPRLMRIYEIQKKREEAAAARAARDRDAANVTGAPDCEM